MAYKFLTLLAMTTIVTLVIAQEPQGASHQNQGRARRDIFDDYDLDATSFPPGASWTACDITVNPILSCHDCSTRIICKPIGGLLKPCKHPSRPHCNGGICSSIPSPGCIDAP